MSYSNFRRPGGYAKSSRSGHSRTRSSGPKKEYIHPSKFVSPAKPADAVEYIPKNTFSDFTVHPLIQINIGNLGFKAPTAIQDQAIPVALEGKDVVGIANTGTGKTVAFGIPVLNRLLADKNSHAIILAPTRELAQQIEKQFREIAKGSGLNGAVLIGGTAMRGQLQDLKYHPQIVIGTPGRIKDHVERGTLKLHEFNIVVLDEVDRMLDMGFINDIRHILGRTATVKQSFFFSATIDQSVKNIIEGFSMNPVQITVKTGDTSDNVEQNVITYNDKNQKLTKLDEVLKQDNVLKTLVFDDTQRSVERLCKELQARGFDADAIHGGKSQGQRQRALQRFRDNQVNILVATDVAARGIDVVDITHIVNYSQPKSYGDYVHRIGRAGRAGRLGYALTFVEQQAPSRYVR